MSNGKHASAGAKRPITIRLVIGIALATLIVGLTAYIASSKGIGSIISETKSIHEIEGERYKAGYSPDYIERFKQKHGREPDFSKGE